MASTQKQAVKFGTFLGLGHTEQGNEKYSATSIDTLTKDLKASILVQNNGMPGTVPILLKLKK